MNVELADITAINYDPSNVRRHDRRNIDAIKASLAKFGQQKPVVVNGDNVIVAGNGTVEAARELGWQQIAVVRTDLEGAEATAYAIADNRTAELAEWGEDLGDVLAGLDTELRVAAGWDDQELEKLLGTATAPTEFNEVNENIETEHACPKCGYRYSGGQ